MEFKESKPIYLQIADRICDQILTATFRETERIPSVREYAATVEVNANTVVRSFDYLQSNNIIFNKRGMGYFVATGAVERITAMRKETFMNESLPKFFREIDMLGISMEEINEMYLANEK